LKQQKPGFQNGNVAREDEELKKMLYYIEDFARNAGIKRLYGGGRQGWIRKLKGLGFKQEYLISKDL
jgi:hypothetical protein